METAILNTPLGIIKISGNKDGVSNLKIIDETLEVSETIPKTLQKAVSQLEEYFNHNRTSFNFLINPKGTDFQKKVWHELQQIPFGKTLSYQELSIKLGDAKAIRAVANANAKNPLWIVIPCHRVIGSNGSLTGYAGGLWRKKWLIEHESGIKQKCLF